MNNSQYITEPATSGKVLLSTTVGDIEVELWTREAPLACRNFIQLCMEGYYNGTVFHRLVKDFIIQGGDPTGTGQGGDSIYGEPFKDEFHQRLRFNRRGLLGMANAGTKDSNGSQFFFTIGTEPARDLDRKHTLFGKVVGTTIFNLLRMTEYEVDKNDRPTTLHKILSTTVLTNPFDDIVPREKKKEKREKRKETKAVETKKLNLLSFGDEAEEDEEELTKMNQKLGSKSKSAHDVLDDASLSKQAAVTADELGDYNPQDEEADPEMADRIRAKFAKKRKLVTFGEEEDEGGEGTKKEEDDLEVIMDEEKRARIAEQKAQMESELREMQKDYLRALRKPKEKKIVEAELTEGMKEYTSRKLKFKSKTKNLVKAKDPNREKQTMSIFERFKVKLEKSTKDDILFDRKVDTGDAKTADEIIGELSDIKASEEAMKEATEPQGEEEDSAAQAVVAGRIDLDAEDEDGVDWMKSRFVAAPPDPTITRAKDANMREIDEDWYDISDPRNKINMRRRGAE